jgi:hypothetical protein
MECSKEWGCHMENILDIEKNEKHIVETEFNVPSSYAGCFALEWKTKKLEGVENCYSKM